ncbi:MAG: ATP-binding cassette domain-containing protein [Butyricicoccus sp.]
MIEIEHLSFSYGSHIVLQDISCVIKPGRMTFLIGQNGAGKSTLFRCILGHLRAQKGQIRLNQRASNQYTHSGNGAICRVCSTGVQSGVLVSGQAGGAHGAQCLSVAVCGSIES